MTIEGGNFQCYIHDYTTADIKQWDNHCTKTGHKLQGVTTCKDCGKYFSFEALAYQPIGQEIVLRCSKCEARKK